MIQDSRRCAIGSRQVVAGGRSFVFLAMTTTLIGTAAAAEPQPTALPDYECRRVVGSIKIDGQADEAAWAGAVAVDSFVMGWAPGGPRPAKTATRARFLWSDEGLYFYAEMDDADLYADVREQDGPTWKNDVFELFFKPTDDRLGYYEFEVSPANTHMEMFLPSRGSGGYQRWARDRDFAWRTAVQLRGTLNDWRERDEGWSVEGMIPWPDFEPTGGRPTADTRWKFALCRYDYSIDFETVDLSSNAAFRQSDYHRYEDYRVIRFCGDESQPQRRLRSE